VPIVRVMRLRALVLRLMARPRDLDRGQARRGGKTKARAAWPRRSAFRAFQGYGSGPR